MNFPLKFTGYYYIIILPARRYMTPVTNIALICFWQTPNAPTSAALPRIIRHTRAHDIDKFCIPVGQEKHRNIRGNYLKSL